MTPPHRPSGHAAPRPAATPSTRAAALALLATLSTTACDPPTAPPAAELMARVAVGVGHTCALTVGGDAWCWGDGTSGQLGTGGTVSEPRPRPVTGGIHFEEIAAGGAHTCGIAADRTAWCWGANDRGQAGTGAAGAAVTTPTAVAGGLTFASLSVGWEHTCGVTTAAEAYCWGRGTEGQLGTGALEDRASPAPVTGAESFTAISAGGRHTCGITTAGEGMCWGANDFGQLGVGAAGEPRSAPAALAWAATLVDIAAGWSHACAVRSDGAPSCWGTGAHGELGTGRWYERDQPGETAPAAVLAEGQTYVSISAGTYYTCGVRNQGEAMCWGRGYEGQLGNGQLFLSVIPQLVRGEPGRRFVLNQGPFVRLDAHGLEHACAVIATRDVVCWGRGPHGQLGIEEWLTPYPQIVRIPPL